MSSRAAAGRKRLTGGDKDDKSSTNSPKGFFSRFKSAKAVDTRINRSLYPNGPQTVNSDSTNTTPYHSRIGLDNVETHQRKRTSFNDVVPQGHLNQAIHIVSNSFPEESRYPESPYIEASYQPPPPTLASYQPPPPDRPTRTQGWRTLPAIPQAVVQSISSVETISEIPAPPSYASPVPKSFALSSSSANSTTPPFLLQSSSSSSTRTNSPTPTYSSIPIPSSVQALPRLQVPDRGLSRKGAGYNQYNRGSPSYPLSSPSQPIVLTYSPLSHTTHSTPSDNHNRSYWDHRASVSPTSQSAYPHRPSSVGSGPPKSTSDSSGSSRRSADLAQRGVIARPGTRDSASMLSDDSIPSTKSPASSIPGNGSGSVHSAVPPSGYVFPVGRSRAQPSKPSTIARNRTGKDKALDSVGDGGKGRKFMGISFNKKKFRHQVEPQNDTSAISPKTEVAEEEIHGFQAPSVPEEVPDYEESLDITHEDSQESLPPNSRIRSYPFDPFDPALLESDLYTAKLLARLNPTGNPTFHNYGNTPPTSVLDLGCGQGHWIIDAANAWKGYGTKVVGYDMVDVSHGLLSRAIEQGVMENVSFFQGNFLEDSLPFDDESFDLVRMSCLTLCITSESWTSVLQEVHRVLMTGGRLEMIDDEVVFPYRLSSSFLRGSTVGRRSELEPIVPRININIPSASLSRTSSIYNVGTKAPLAISTNDIADHDIHNLVPLEEEADIDDTCTINGLDVSVAMNPNPIPRALGSDRHFGISSIPRNDAVDSSKNLESLFHHMLLYAFDIRPDSGEFIAALMKEVFGYAREMHTMNLSSDGSGVGLVLWPSTLLPMDQAEINIHATRYPRLLLSSKDILIEHAIDVMNEDEDDVDEALVLGALKNYEEFLPYRLGFSHSPTFSESRSGSRESGTDIVSDVVASNFGTLDSFAPASKISIPRRTRTELTHVRNFRIYEAIKLDRTLFSTAA